MKKTFLLYLITSCCSVCFSQMNTLADHGLNTSVEYLTSYRQDKNKIVPDQGMDSTRFYFNNKEFADSIISYSGGVIINKLSFEYSKDLLVKKHFSGEIRGQLMNMTWEKTYKSDTAITSLKKGGSVIRIDTAIINKSDSIETITTKSQTIIQTFNTNGQKNKTEVYKDGNLVTTNYYEYDTMNQLIRIKRTWPNDSGTSTDSYKLILDTKGNWIERVSYNIVGFEEQYSSQKTIREIKY